MSARADILGRIKRTKEAPDDSQRAMEVARRLSSPPKGIIPARGQLDAKGRTALFCKEAEKVSATVRKVKARADVPKAVAAYLRSKNLPSEIRMGEDSRFSRMPWKKQRALEIKNGASDGDDEAAISYASGAIAESGTLVLCSGAANPTTLNFLPEHHIVIVDAKDVAGDMETVITRLRKTYGRGELPRNVNLISGPSRSGDVEQTIILGAHGPRALHIIIVD